MGMIKSTLANFLTILCLAPFSGVVFTYMGGELHGWKDLPRAFNHSLFAGTMLAFGWLVMASPLAVRLRTLLSSFKMTGPDGTVVETQRMLVSEQPPAPVPPPTEENRK